ncbi:putative adaptin [Trypanosoma rangeli]|uniref:Putative adaptin n=1 Tax=Trypanosoma rangeli TaxID=5698 RepID=A0A422NM75_TRYRA|nr:putative adaptin [Trypanosoma rangeli]RNF06598.1 putative adaptin [Trypanosoma rangeli]|eukprot:RNF06598.1 putative adaptin [Trypanosoma rangeli]
MIAEKATFVSERAKELISGGGNVVSRARSLISGDAQFFSVQPKEEDLRQHLDSDSLQEKRNAMKRIIAQMCKGNDMSSLFADVVKNVHTPSIELRKLIYFYITHYSEDRPNEALLSISAFQKDLMHPSLHVRSLALRMLSTIRIPAIQPLVLVAVKKCASDLEPLVRKTAAISLAQMHAISADDGDSETILKLLGQLLADKCTEVASAAALSFIEICPDKMDLIHPIYRDLCCSLVDCEEWGQVVLLHVLLRYARTQFMDPNRPSQPNVIQQGNKEKKNLTQDIADAKVEGASLTSSLSSSSASASSSLASFTRASSEVLAQSNKYNLDEASDSLLDFDHRLLLDSVKPLFMSLNSAVVVAATSLFFHCAPKKELGVCVKPLVRLLGGPEEQHAIVLSAIYTVVLSQPEPFVAYIKEFYLLPQDVRDVRKMKIQIMSKLITVDNCMELFREFRGYLRNFHVENVVDTVRGLGLIAGRLPNCASKIMHLLVPLMSHPNAEVVSESISVLRLLAVQGSDTARTCQLVYSLLNQVLNEKIMVASAKASILWLVGENIQRHTVIATAAPECFRVFVKRFAQESLEVKKQVLTLGCKIWLFLDGSSSMADRFRKLFFYVLEVAHFDEDYEVRDYCRLIRCTVDRQSSAFAALKSVLLSEKPLPQSNDPYVERTQYQLGTMSHLFGTSLLGYRQLPPWLEVATDPLLRGSLGAEDSVEDSSRGSGSDFSSTLGSSDTETSALVEDGSNDASSRSASSADTYSYDEEETGEDASTQRSSSASFSVAAGACAAVEPTPTNRTPVSVVAHHVDPAVAPVTVSDVMDLSPGGNASVTEADELKLEEDTPTVEVLPATPPCDTAGAVNTEAGASLPSPTLDLS